MDTLSSALLPHGKGSWNLKGSFALSLAGLTGVLVLVLSLLFSYAPDVDDQHTQRYYMYLRGALFSFGAAKFWALVHQSSLCVPPARLADVYVMVFLGFGFLMTFLKRYSFSAVGLNMVGSCLIILEAIVCVGIVQQGVKDGLKSRFIVDLPLVIDSAFCAGAGMITFGAVLGKVRRGRARTSCPHAVGSPHLALVTLVDARGFVCQTVCAMQASPTQVIWLLALEVPIYALNAHVVAEVFEVLDVGESLDGVVRVVPCSCVLMPTGTEDLR